MKTQGEEHDQQWNWPALVVPIKEVQGKIATILGNSAFGALPQLRCAYRYFERFHVFIYELRLLCSNISGISRQYVILFAKRSVCLKLRNSYHVDLVGYRPNIGTRFNNRVRVIPMHHSDFRELHGIRNYRYQ